MDAGSPGAGSGALANGYHLYFADHYQLGQTTSAFVRAGRIQLAQTLALPGLEPGARFAGQCFKVEFTNAG